VNSAAPRPTSDPWTAPASLMEPSVRSLTVPGRAEQVGVAREFVADVLGMDHPLADTAVLLTSELVTNSLRHSASGHEGGTISVAVAQSLGSDGVPDLVRVEVTDDGSDDLPAQRLHGHDDESGYGLQLVDTLAFRWGCRRDGSGATTTWFVITG
jgi:anti-sigma regulatory factor (Ser/Thr protein kinase)